MDSKCKAQLMNARSYAEAKPILETLNLSTSGEELARTAYQIREAQPSVAEHFLRTVIREADDVTDALKHTDTDKKDGLKETDDNSENQSTSTTGLEKIGTEDAPSTANTLPDQKDQMGVSINEMGFPPQGMGQPQQENGIPPAGGAPPPPMPPAAPPAMPPQNGGLPPQQMMRYTITETMKIINPQLRKIVEAITALDTKIQETAVSQIKSLEVGSKMGLPSKPQLIRETTGDVSTDIKNRGQSIKQFNDALNQGYIQ